MLYKGKEHFLKSIKELPGVKVELDKNDIVIISIDKFSSCKKIFDRPDINWCIAKDAGHWLSYVDHDGRKQYFLIDFNDIASSDREKANLALIGFTTQGNKLYAAHAKDDHQLFKEPFYKVMAEKGIEKNVKRLIEGDRKITLDESLIIMLIILFCFAFAFFLSKLF